MVTAVKAQFYQTAEEARPLEIQEARQQAWFLIYHTSGLNWSWFEATTFFEEMFGHENTVIKAREQYIWRRNYFLGEVPWDIRNVSILIQSVHVSATPFTDALNELRALYAAISAYEVETGLAIAEIVRRRQYKGWPRVVREQMLGFGAVERIPMRTVRVKYLQAFPRRPAVQQQQQQRVPELLNPHWND